MHNLVEKSPDFVTHFTIGWMSTYSPHCDWFLGGDFSFVKIHGFTEEPFRFPFCVTDHTLALEMFRQLVMIENSIGSGKHDVAITQDHKIIGLVVLEKRLHAEGVLTSKLV